MRNGEDAGGPSISVVVTTYNHEAFIAECLERIIAQRHDHPCEVLVIDDASTDRTPAILSAYANEYPGLVRPIFNAVNHRSRGWPVMSKALAEARGDYVALCDGDDYWDCPDKLRRQVRFLERHPDYAFCFHDAYNMVNGSIRYDVPENQPRDYSPEDLKQLYGWVLLGTIVFRRSVGPLPREFDSAPNRDRILPVILGFHGAGGYLADIGPLIRRVHPGGYWTSQSTAGRFLMHARTDLAIARYLTRVAGKASAEIYTRGAMINFKRFLRAARQETLPPAAAQLAGDLARLSDRRER